MKRKLYAKYNRRSKMIEFVFVDINDDNAIYNYELANIEAKKKNPFYRDEDYNLICLGVILMEGEAKEVGIIYDYKEDFNVVFDDIKDFQKPKFNEEFFNEMKTTKENEKIIKEKAGIKGE